MAEGAFRIFLLLVVLIQYTPVRICAIERVVVGLNCHDRGDHAVLGEDRTGEASCGKPMGFPDPCHCEQPKVDGQHQLKVANAPVDWATLPVAAVSAVEASMTPISSVPDLDPHRGASVAMQFPLLI